LSAASPAAEETAFVVVDIQKYQLQTVYLSRTTHHFKNHKPRFSHHLLLMTALMSPLLLSHCDVPTGEVPPYWPPLHVVRKSGHKKS